MPFLLVQINDQYDIVFLSTQRCIDWVNHHSFKKALARIQAGNMFHPAKVIGDIEESESLDPSQYHASTVLLTTWSFPSHRPDA
jgi:hypothetical protein